ncbi:MAG: MFS transporter [Vicinamibacteria bacterium]|nr:MFS transporter [Vicinamibacteria bacterium]
MPTTAAARKLKWTLFGAQAMGSAGFLVASTVTPIVGAQLSGRPAYAGVPSAFYWAGGALATLLWGRLMDPLGRRKTLVLGLLVGVVGASLASVFVVRQSFLGFIVGLALMGAANSALQLARFMAGEVHRLEERGRAISTVVLGGTVGAVLGPTLVAPMSTLATSLGGPPLAGPYAASAAFFSLGAVLVALLLWPDPRDLARQVHRSAASSASTVRSVREILGDPGVRIAGLTMAIAQVVMVMLMVITSLHMSHHHHALSSIAAVMSSHVFGMYAFSVVSGRIADRFGRGPLIGVGAVVLVISCLLATLSTDVTPLAIALFLLGLGWNFCYVGGSTLLSDCLSQDERARIQSFNDFLLTSLAGTGSALSGLVFSSVGYAVMGYVSAAVSLILVVLSRNVRRYPSSP